MTQGRPALPPLRYPRLWWSLWWLAIVVVVVLSLMPPISLSSAPEGSDKWGHFAAYFVLAASATQLITSRTGLLLAGAGLVLLGIGLEFAQGALTEDRMRDPMDALANTLGVVAGLALAWTPARGLLRWLETRWFS